MTTTHASTIRHQQATLALATNHREPWAPHEVELLTEPGEAAELAVVLGRTLYAVQSARHQLAQGVTLGGGPGAGAGTRPGREACPCHGRERLPSGGCPMD
jgi:hypothetical protein